MDECKSNEIKIIIGEEKVLYISTLSGLGGEMLKLDFPSGEYGLHPFNQGYYLGVKDYSAKIKDAIHVFNIRDGHKGLMGTYHDGYTNNLHLVRIFNCFISKHLPDKWWEHQSYNEDDFETGKYETVEYKLNESYDDDYMRGEVKCLKSYNNIPVFFYLTKQINVSDLSNIKLESAAVINNCGNVNVCWYVLHSIKGRIGIAVQQKELFDMMGDQAGLCLLSSNGCRAVGNLYCYDIINLDEEVFHPGHKYECEFKPCFCDYEYDFERKRREARDKRYGKQSTLKMPKFISSARALHK